MNRALSPTHTLFFFYFSPALKGKKWCQTFCLRALLMKRCGVIGRVLSLPHPELHCSGLVMPLLVLRLLFFRIPACFCRSRVGNLWGVSCRLCLCRVPSLSNVLFVPKRRQPGVRENLCSMNHSEVLPLVAPLSPARRFAGEWTQITALSTSLLPTPASFLAFVLFLFFSLLQSMVQFGCRAQLHANA